MGKRVARTIHLTEAEARELGELTAAGEHSESALLRQWVLRGMRELRIERAARAYQRDEVDLRGGAAMAGIPIGLFVEELAERRISVLSDVAAMEEELEDVIREFGLAEMLTEPAQ